MSRNYLLGTFIVSLILLLGAVFFLSKGSTGSNPKTSSVPKSDLTGINRTDWVTGKKDSPVVLIEYLDFQCPACKIYYPVVKQLEEDYKEKIAFVYRHFPLNIHKNSKISAKAVEAAGKQGQFFKMKDTIYENQEEWSESSNPQDLFIKYAGALGLNIEQFKTDLNSKALEEKINADTTAGLSLGINATPTFLLNGEKIQPASLQEFKDLLDKALVSADSKS